MIENKEKNFISVVAYVHNSEQQLNSYLDMITGFLKKQFLKYEIIFVNDNSDDHSIETIKNWIDQKKYDHMVSIVNMSYYQGLELSMNAGVDLAIGDFVYEFDDLTLDYEESLIEDLYRKSLQGYDIVAAIPEGRKDIFSSIFYKIYNKNKESISSYELERENFRILSRRAINRVSVLSQSIPYRKALYLNCGLPYTGIAYKPLQSLPRNYDKVQNKNRVSLAIDSLILFTNFVGRVSLILSLAFLSFAFFAGIYTIMSYFSANKPVAGWAPIMGFLSAGFFGIFMILTIIIKYLSLVLKMIFRKQEYLLQSIEKITR